MLTASYAGNLKRVAAFRESLRWGLSPVAEFRGYG